MKRQMIARRALILGGAMLVVISVCPVVIGMVRAFQQSGHAMGTTDVNAGVSLAFHPIFIACGLIGIAFIVIGIVMRGS